jgi:hypothetical protein
MVVLQATMEYWSSITPEDRNLVPYLVDLRAGFVECLCVGDEQHDVGEHLGKRRVRPLLDLDGDHLQVDGVLDDLVVVSVLLPTHA